MMFCTRCQIKVPDFLWDNNDHLSIDGPMIINMNNPILNPDLMEVIVKVRVKKIKCSEEFIINVR